MPRHCQNAGPCGVYRHFDANGALLYIGASFDPLRRFMGHLTTARWATRVASITVEWFESRAEAEAAERAAIEGERPPYNTFHNPKPPTARRRAVAGPILGRWLMKEGEAVAAFAQRSEIPAARVFGIIRGEVSPNSRTARKIADATRGELPAVIWNRGGEVPRWTPEPEAGRARHLLASLSEAA